jgi:hypothetical protein
MMNTRSIAGLVTGLAFACARRNDMQTTAGAGRLVAGQIWSYKTRPGEEGSRLTVLKTESHPKLGNVIHVAVAGVRIKNPRVPGGVSSTVGHMPYQEVALRASLVGVTGQEPSAPDLEGYRTWKEAFDQGKAGIWSISVAEAVAAIEKIANQ